ncbi:MAG: hypothetical protein WDA71_03370 [Actinomycetota bacterium]
MRIVLVNYLPEVRKVLTEQFLAPAGIDVAGEAGDPEEARRVVARLLPDAVVVAHLLPEPVGAALVAQFRERYPGMAGVLYSTLPAEEMEGQHLLADAFVETGDLRHLPAIIGRAVDAVRSSGRP